MIDICESSGFLQALLILKSIFKIICLLIPIILIFTISMDTFKLVTNPGDTKKVFPVISKRLIAALVVFFVPTIINIVLNAMGQGNDVSRCYNNANSEYIESLREREKANRKETKHNLNNNSSADITFE